MYKVGIICGEEYFREVPIQQFIAKLKKTFGPTATVVGAGNSKGGDLYVKKHALLNGLPYKEYNPSFTGLNMYSAMDESYYGKNFHPTHFQHRYQMMINNCDMVVFFPGNKIDPALEYAQKYVQKRKLKTVSCE